MNKPKQWVATHLSDEHERKQESDKTKQTQNQGPQGNLAIERRLEYFSTIRGAMW